MAINDDELILRDIEPQDAVSLVALARENLHSQWTKEFVQWKYFQNSTDSIAGCCAEAKGDLVGFYGNVPVQMKLGKSVVRSVQAADAMVASTARRRGLFVKMENHVYKEAIQSGVQLSYALPNPISKAAFVKHMAWKYVGELPRYVSILNARRVVQLSNLSGVKALLYYLFLSPFQSAHRNWSDDQIRQTEAVDARFDKLWAEVASHYSIAVERSASYLNWRYIQNPLIRYTILTAEIKGNLHGYIILSHKDMDKGIMAIADWLVSPLQPLLGSCLLKAAKEYAHQQGAAQIQCWMLSQHTIYIESLKKQGFFFFNRQYLPGIFRATTPLIIKVSAKERLSPNPHDMSQWYMTMGDHDYY